jgi:hypothetical protein
VEIPDELLHEAAECYWTFAFDEGDETEIRNARIAFNELNRKAFELASKSALMQGFHRPTQGEFRENFIDACRAHLRKTGKLQRIVDLPLSV